MTRSRKVYWGVLAVALGAAIWPAVAPDATNPMPIAEFGRLPILEGGRIKPLDSFARNSLLMIRDTQTLYVDGKARSATQWLLDALFLPSASDTYKVFTIDDPDMLGLLQIKNTKERRFAFWQIEPFEKELRTQAQKADAIASTKRTRFQTAAVNLAHRVDLYEQIKNTIMVSGSEDPLQEMQAWTIVSPLGRTMSAPPKDVKLVGAYSAYKELTERYQFLAGAAAFRPLAPLEGEPEDGWTTMGQRMLRTAGAEDLHPGAAAYAQMALAWKKGDAAAFRIALTTYQDWLKTNRRDAVAQGRNEVVFNRAQPFISGMALYIATLLAVFTWWASRRDEAQSAARALMLAALLVHTVGLVSRIVLQGRPPVTNLYSSAVFVGWVAALLGFIAERIHRKGFAVAGGALLGFCTLLIAQHLSASGDTMEMMRAVLDSNFWLGTHVVTVTIGYASTFLAGAMGIAWVLRRHFVKDPDPETSRALVSIAYGIVAFSMLFSFVGTMLGGIWADQSWGRFWGWDPKENGALLIVLWNALILHARWSGIARERGFMTMTLFGNVVTSLSWFGVNMLGIGLHSYGFMDKAFYWLSAFVLSQLALLAFGLMPPGFWRSAPARPA